MKRAETCSCSYLLTPSCRVLLETLTGLQLVKKVHYRTHKRPPPFSILGLPNPIHIPTSHLLEIHPNIHLTNSLAAALRDPALQRFLRFQVPIFIPHCLLRNVSPGNTAHPTPPPHWDPSGGVVYLWIVLSPEQASHLWMFLNRAVLQRGVVSTSPNLQTGGPTLLFFM
jgi:hypothetical protein